MITVLFFAKYKEELQTDQLQLDWQPQWQSLRDIRDHLAQRGAPWTILEDPKLMCALNEEMCSLSTPVKAGDEVVFFPMVTGG
ncbi:molybdopterin converting factor, small subunit [Pseudomonas saudimassiliensis]|uniref:Molybdopterin converting factor, small subunit n=1 Tax=Pseudomonas saudimassiliensis TaxID=1461581 RepID=A0A078MAB5_9PSED|nr:MoaD/ThiS family protein [Pseudomonas saudimassiliensis]CEA04343.1 molybdopterin converting factor, small subunit [Pseudomonas saudimassiliensis]CEF26540.1 molybdopterin converting factor, small subunit [Pseudomonas saudimassiliensis]